MSDITDFILQLPKVELHLHIEGSFEPELMFAIAARNQIDIPYENVEALRAAYNFNNLQEFLDIYYQGMQVLQTEQDYYDLTFAYLKKVNGQNVRHVEIFWDPQGHLERGIDFGIQVKGIHRALSFGLQQFDISFCLIMSFLRHLPELDALDTLALAEPYLDKIDGVGLDSSEVGFPPELFTRVFAASKAKGLRLTAHAGEEGPPSYIYEALDLLKVDRIDHGNRSMEDAKLIERLVSEQKLLTLCPLSNTKLQVVKAMTDHPLKQMLDKGLKVSIHSDDPAYFGGYVNENYVAVAEALNLNQSDIITLARNSIEGSWCDEARKAVLLEELGLGSE